MSRATGAVDTRHTADRWCLAPASWWCGTVGGAHIARGRRSGEASHSRVVLVIVADDHNVAADMLWLTGVDAVTCNDVCFASV